MGLFRKMTLEELLKKQAEAQKISKSPAQKIDIDENLSTMDDIVKNTFELFKSWQKTQ